jgi:peptidoglycan/xylan/chitin deacetylase (PgdA/CDA1 family)
MSAPILQCSRCAPGAASRAAAWLLLIACVLIMAALPATPAAFAAPRSHETISAVVILVYHRFSDTADDSMTVRVTTFEAHLRFLRERGYQIVPLRQIVAWLREPNATLPSRVVALTVDDGHESVYQRLLPIAQREQLPITLFVYPSAISNASYALTWEQLRAMRATGLFDVQSHTWWHPNFNVERRRQSPAEFERFATAQLQHSRELIESELGGHVDMLAWPFGVYDDEVMHIASNLGYVAAFTLNARRVDRVSPLLALPRFLMVDDVTPRILGRLLGEPDTPLVNATEAPPMKRLAAVLSCTATFLAVDIPPSRAAFEVRGVIVDESTHRPIPYATVTLDDKPRYADADGTFSSASTVRIVAARAPGYRSASVSPAPDQPLVVLLAPFRARGVYLSVYGVASPTLRKAAVALKDTNGINALVIDAKGDRGLTSYASEARESIGAAATAPSPAPVVRDMAALLLGLHREGLYLIARIVVFKDDPLASAHPEWSVRDAQGNAWRDREKLQWVDPFRHEVWKHNLDVAEEAARLGFDEIQFVCGSRMHRGLFSANEYAGESHRRHRWLSHRRPRAPCAIQRLSGSRYFRLRMLESR